MRYYVYILWSIKAHRTYAGQTEDVENRLDRHNRGLVRSTKAYRPWVLVYAEECATRSEAMNLESWLKSPSGRKWISKVIKEWEGTGLSVPLLRTTERDRDSAKRNRTKPA